MFAVEFDDDLVSQAQVGVRRTDGSRQNDTTACRHVAGFDHCPVDLAQITVTCVLRHSGKVHVDKFHVPIIDLLAQDRIGLIRRAEADGLGFGKRAIE